MNYDRIYSELVSRAKMRDGAGLSYFETHHVLPRALGGTNEKSNLVKLTAREHFVAHWLLFKIHNCPATARAFKLMANDQQKKRGRSYEQARQKMSEAMRGDANVAKRPEVRAKLKQNVALPFLGKKRPEHAEVMRKKSLFVGDSNPARGNGDAQRGALNPYAVPLLAEHPLEGQRYFATQTEMAKYLGVSQAAVQQAMRKGQKTKGWKVERAA